MDLARYLHDFKSLEHQNPMPIPKVRTYVYLRGGHHQGDIDAD
jgi:hypothetical protein